ncbi:MAG: oligosaccharide flippase family protein [Zhenhengia sp.]
MKNNQLKMGAMLSYATLLVSNVIGILYTPIMLRLMGQGEYGLYSLVASVVGYLTVLDMGLGNAIVRYTAKYRALEDKEGEYRLNGMFIIIYSLIGVAVAAIGVGLYTNVDKLFGATLSQTELTKASLMMVLLVLNLAVSFPLGVFGSIMTAYERFVFPKIVNIIRVLINPCIMLPLLLMGYKSVTMVLVMTMLNIASLLTNVWYCFARLHIKISFGKWDIGLLKEIGGYSLFIFLNIIIDKLYWSTDQLILGMVSGTTMVAIYAVGAQLNNYYMNFSTAISGVFLPRITMMVTHNESQEIISKLFMKVSRIQYLVMSFILSGFILFGRRFITLWAGSDYDTAYFIALIVMVPSIIPLSQNLGITILQARNKHRFRSVVYIMIAIVNVVLSIPLAKMWGGIGCALATSFATFIGQIVIMNIYYYKVAGIDIPRYWKEIGRITMGVAIAMLIGAVLITYIDMQNILLYGVGIVLYSCIFLGIVWCLGMDAYEKELVGQQWEKIVKGMKR